jgi:hypothetical protein
VCKACARPCVRYVDGVRPVLDIIIPAYAPSEKLQRCVASICDTTASPFNLIVVCRKQCVAANRNEGLRMAHAPYVAFLDDDVELPTGWDTSLIETLETTELPDTLTVSGVTVDKPFVGMVGPRIVSADGSPQNQSSHVPDGERRVEYVCGAVMLWKRERWPSLMADTNYVGSGHEDTDLTMQMLVQGGVSVVDGRVTVKHHNGMVNGTGKNQEQNSRYFRTKWEGYMNAARGDG